MSASPDDAAFMKLVQSALTEGLDSSVYERVLRLPDVVDFDGIVAEKVYDSSPSLPFDAAGMRLDDSPERDLVFEFDEGLLAIEISERGILARAPEGWEGAEIRLETIRSVLETTVDDDGIFELDEVPFLPFRIIAMTGSPPKATRWILP